jgi:hypothetical protein
LGKGGKALWRAVLSENRQLRKASQREVLEMACRARDRADELRQQIDERGVVVPCGDGGNSVKANPLLNLEAIAQNQVTKFLRQLHVLDDERDRRMGRPPNMKPSA